MIIGRIAALLVVAAALPVACRSKPMPPAASTAGSAGSSTATPEARREAYAAAVKALSKQVNAPKDSIVGVSQDETTWNDACLGCAGSGEKCAQVLTPGYRVFLRLRPPLRRPRPRRWRSRRRSPRLVLPALFRGERQRKGFGQDAQRRGRLPTGPRNASRRISITRSSPSFPTIDTTSKRHVGRRPRQRAR
jgi:hypothetical protein